MKPIVVATGNPGKVALIAGLLADLPVDWQALGDVAPDFDVEENGATFEENAVIKASEVAKRLQLAAIANDGGLEIPALGGWPGLHSRRIKNDGSAATDAEIIEITGTRIATLAESDRIFRFVSVMAFALPNGTVTIGRGELVGTLTLDLHPSESTDFPFRRFWKIPRFDKYFLDLTKDELATVNHNALALNQLRPAIETYLKS